MRLQQLPNVITVIRLLLIPPLMLLILQERVGAALLLFVLAGLSDLFDGLLARHFNWGSPLGGILDPIADKLLIVGTYLALAAEGRLPVWLVVAALLRDAVILGGAAGYRYWVGPYQASPSFLSKLNTLMLLGVAVIVMLPWPMPPGQGETLSGLFILALCTIVASGADYVSVWGGRASRALRAGRENR